MSDPVEDADGLSRWWWIVPAGRSQSEFVVPVVTALGPTRHAYFRVNAFVLSHRQKSETVVGTFFDLEEIFSEPFGERSLTPALSPWQLRYQNKFLDFRFVGVHFVGIVAFLVTTIGQRRQGVATNSSRQPIATRLTALTAPRASGPFNRENATLLQPIHVVLVFYPEQPFRTQDKPLVYRRLNPVEDVGRVTLVGVEDYSSFDVQTVDAARGQIRRTDVSGLSAAAVAEVDGLRVVETVSVAHDSEKRVGPRQPENPDQLTYCGRLRFAVIGTNKDYSVEVFACQTLERLAEHTENTSFEEPGLPSNPDDIRRQDVS